MGLGRLGLLLASSSSSYYINDRQHSGSLSNVLSRLAVEVRVDGDELELELELELLATGSGVSTMLAESSVCLHV